MPLELRLTFPDPAQVSVALLGGSQDFTQPAPFTSPLKEKDLQELRWYVVAYIMAACMADDHQYSPAGTRLRQLGPARSVP